MKGLLVVVALLVIGGAVGLMVNRMMAGRQIGPGPEWRLIERGHRGSVVVEILPPGGTPGDAIPVAVLDPGSEDFEYLLEEARSEARVKLVALNQRMLGT